MHSACTVHRHTKEDLNVVYMLQQTKFGQDMRLQYSQAVYYTIQLFEIEQPQ